MKYYEHQRFRQIPVPCTGKRKAFQKGWEAREAGKTKSDNPYDPRVKHFMPTNPYFNFWDLGYEYYQEELTNFPESGEKF